MVFISHSSREDPFAGLVCQALPDAIRDRRWESFVDMKAFRGGEEWQGILYTKLVQCDAAIILISEAAMKSSWVRREVFMLLWRHALGSPVTFIPVLLGDVTINDIKDSDFAELERIQAPVLARTGGPDEARDVAERIAALLPEAGTAWPADSPMRRWLEDVTFSLREVMSLDVLVRAARELDPDDAAMFAAVPEGQSYLAHQLLGAGPEQPLHNAVTLLARRGADLPRLIGLIKPSWVDPDAARRLLARPGRVAALLNAGKSETARQYVQRASCCSLNFLTECVSLASGEDQAEQFRRDCLIVLRKALGCAPDDPLDGEEPAPGDVVFLVIDPAEGPAAVIAETLPGLLAQFPWLNVIVLTGGAGPDAAAVADLVTRVGRAVGAVAIRPELEPGAERRGGRIVGRLDRILADVGA